MPDFTVSTTPIVIQPRSGGRDVLIENTGAVEAFFSDSPTVAASGAAKGKRLAAGAVAGLTCVTPLYAITASGSTTLNVESFTR